jgi:hypothetical protein
MRATVRWSLIVAASVPRYVKPRPQRLRRMPVPLGSLRPRTSAAAARSNVPAAIGASSLKLSITRLPSLTGVTLRPYLAAPGRQRLITLSGETDVTTAAELSQLVESSTPEPPTPPRPVPPTTGSRMTSHQKVKIFMPNGDGCLI